VQAECADGEAERMARLVPLIGRRAVRREGRRAVRREGRKAVRREGRKAVRREGREAVLELPQVHQAIICCDRCPRLRGYCTEIARVKKRAFRDQIYWGRPVPGFGDPNARLLLIGLAPAAHGANRTGRVFTGDGAGGSGDFLMAALHRAGFANIPTARDPSDGLQLTDAFIAAAVRCAPPANKPTPEEIANCLPHLDNELAALPRVRVIVALGRIGFDAYLRLLKRRGIVVRPRPGFGHAAVHRLPHGHTVIGCYHPSRQNTNTGKLDARMMDEVFARARQALRSS
jgi:uracil-DNA glycosylase family 4